MQPMFEALLDDGGYPAAICFMAGVGLNDVMMDRLMPSFENIAKKYTDRAMVMSIMVWPERRHQLEALGYLIYEDPTRGINAMAALTRYGKAFAAKDGRAAPPALPKDSKPLVGGRSLDEAEAKAAFAAAGLPVVEEIPVQSAADAAKRAEERRVGKGGGRTFSTRWSPYP